LDGSTHRHFHISRNHNFCLAVAKIGLQGSGIEASIRKHIAAGMPQHVRMACRRVGSSSEEERGNSSKVIANQVAIWT
jgi:hypothetical protein